MKRILLTSTALVAFAGAAAADGHAGPTFSFSGDAELKYNTGGTIVNKAPTPVQSTKAGAFTWGLDINVAASQALDNGLTAAVGLELDILDNNLGDDGVGASDFVLSLTSDDAGLYFGDTAHAAKSLWKAAGDMEADGFSSNDDQAVLRGKAKFGDVEVQLSYIVDNGLFAGDTDITADAVAPVVGGGDGAVANDQDTAIAGTGDLTQLSLGAKAVIGSVTAVLAYQEEVTLPTLAGNTVFAKDGDFTAAEIVGLSLSTNLSGADITLAHAAKKSGATKTSSTGINVSYPVNDQLTVAAYFVSEDGAAGTKDNSGVSVAYKAGDLTLGVYARDEQGKDDMGFDVTYAVGNGISLFAGMSDGDGSDEGFYAGGSMDLGGGAALRVVHVDADNFNADNEYFGADDAIGTTVALTFKF